MLEADADGLGRRMFGFGGRSHGLDPAGGSGQSWWVQAVIESLGTALLCSKPLSQSHPEFCRGVNTSQGLPISWVLSPLGFCR